MQIECVALGKAPAKFAAGALAWLASLAAWGQVGDPSGPAVVRAPRLALGAAAGEVAFTDLRFLRRSLADFPAAKAFALVFTATDCPIVRRYLPRLAELDRELGPRGVRIIAIDVAPGDSILDVAELAVEHELAFPCVKDLDGKIAQRLGVSRTPEVCVLDPERRLVYRGRIDSLYRLGGVQPSAGRSDLREALEDVLAGRAVRVPETDVDGCAITFEARDPGALLPAPDYAADVAPIVAAHCRECHQPGGEAPFSLCTRADLAGHAAMVAEVVEQRRMPPWLASPRYGHFENARGLSDAERGILLRWLAANDTRPPTGAGDDGEPRETPCPERTLDWQIGTPDLVLRQVARTRLPASGIVPYQYVVLPHVFAEDTWIEAAEIRPENARVLHHCNMGWVRLGDSFDEEHFITGLVPGGDAYVLEPGVAYCIPKGSLLGLQAHYVTSGSEESDRLSVALRFPRAKVDRRARHLEITNRRFEIPPFAAAHPVRAERKFEGDATGIGMFVHMHLRGRDMTFRAFFPDEREEILLRVPSYSFDWQASYRWHRGAQRFPRGTRVECLAHFDNSAFNPYNPDPTRAVRFGQETTDEMMYGFLFYTLDSERLDLEIDPATGTARRQ